MSERKHKYFDLPLGTLGSLARTTAAQASWAEGDFLRNITYRMTELLLSLGADPSIPTPRRPDCV